MNKRNSTNHKQAENKQETVTTPSRLEEGAGSERIQQHDVTTQKDLLQNVLEGFKGVQSMGASNRKSGVGAGVLTLVNSEKNGKRVAIARDVITELGSLTSVQIALSENEIAIGEQLPSSNTFFLRKSGSKGVIYSADLVQELTKHFDLDFTERVSMTFYKVRYEKVNELPVAIITINENEVNEQ